MEPDLLHPSPTPTQPNLGGGRHGENANIRTGLKIGFWRINKCGENCVKVGEQLGNIDSQVLLSYQEREGWCSYTNKGHGQFAFS